MRKWTLNEDYFSRIDTTDKAYWLGFIAADGCILTNAAQNHKPYGLRIHLAPRDKDHLHKLAQAVGSDSPIRHVFYKQYESCKLELFSIQFAQNLMNHGISPNKTSTLTPWHGPRNLMPHYWRGLIDGDGHVSDNPATLVLCGTSSLIEGFRGFAHDICGTEVRPQKQETLWYLHIGGAWQTPKLLKEIYTPGDVALSRKFQIAQVIIDNWKIPQRSCRLCDGVFHARGFCRKHYSQWFRSGKPNVFLGQDANSEIIRHR